MPLPSGLTAMIHIAWAGAWLLACLISIPALAQDTDFTPPAEGLRALIADAREISAAAGEAVWPGWNAAPFGILLVEADQETLFCHGPSADGFSSLGDDSATGCPMQARVREFEPTLLASFPAAGGVPTIVAGTPEATGKEPLDWTVTLLHEHFHQAQSSASGYYEAVEALGLSGDDTSGMWMLNYPFPYDEEPVGAAFAELTSALEAALDARGTEDFTARLETYLDSRADLRATVSGADWRGPAGTGGPRGRQDQGHAQQPQSYPGSRPRGLETQRALSCGRRGGDAARSCQP